MHNAHGFDLLIAIVSEPRFDDLRIDAMTPIARNEIDIETKLRSDLTPQDGELARLEHQDAIARRQRIHQRCLPGSRARRGKDNGLRSRFENFLQTFENVLCHPAEFRPPMIDRGTRHRSQYTLRNVRGTGDLEKLAAA